MTSIKQHGRITKLFSQQRIMLWNLIPVRK